MQYIEIEDDIVTREINAVDDGAAYITLELVQPKEILDSGTSLGYLIVGLPVVYVLKKLSDEAVSRFSKWSIDKIGGLFKTHHPALIEIRVKLTSESNEISLCSIELPITDIDSEQIARNTVPVVLLILRALQCGIIPTDVGFAWDEKKQCWLIRSGSLKVDPLV
jgi:hypothetical protein